MGKKDERIRLYTDYCLALPVERKTVYYEAFHVNQIMAGNPFALFRYLIESEEYSDYEHYWVYREDDYLAYDTFSRYIDDPRVHVMKAFSEEHLRALATCEYLVSNSSLLDFWQKREGQVYINTWHGTPLKLLGRAAGDYSEHAVSNTQRNLFHCDYFVLQNQYTVDAMLDSYDLRGIYPGKILDMGAPRTDLVLNADTTYIRGLLEKKVGRSLAGKEIVLYAPTFRSDSGGIRKNTSDETIGYIEELIEKLPEGYEVFCKVHTTAGKFYRDNDKIADHIIIDEIETNELLSVADVLITDYSSIFFDYLCKRKPILFFTYDMDEYMAGRGTYFDMKELPGPLCYTVDEMVDFVQKVQAEGFTPDEKYERSIEKFAYNDDGHVCEKVVRTIFQKDDSYSQWVSTSRDDKENLLFEIGDCHFIVHVAKMIEILKSLDYSRQRALISCYNFKPLHEHIRGLEGDIKILGSRTRLNMTEPEEKQYERNPDQMPEAFYARQRNKFHASVPVHRVYTMLEDKSVMGHLYEAELIQIPRDFKADKPIVLFPLTFDSVNSVLFPVIEECDRRGYYTVVLSYSNSDKVNQKMFEGKDIYYIPIGKFKNKAVDHVDVVVAPPLRHNAYRKLLSRIRKKDIPVISFATLFSSITMHNNADYVFCIGENKFRELQENYLRYKCFIVGNPQYDSLLTRRRERISQEEIKEVLIIDQGGYPYGDKGKQQLADTLTSIVRFHPDKRFTVKPRYLPDELGQKVHNISEHLYDYFGDIPENLTLMDKNRSLEEMIPEYDAIITTWSTAYMDALVYNMPMILIDGLDSVDVFDVRRQRVEEAYRKLRRTGCVSDFRDLQAQKTEFRYADEEYVNTEIRNHSEPCTPKVADAIQVIADQVKAKGRRPDPRRTDFSTAVDVDDFRDYVENAPYVAADDVPYAIIKRYLNRLNTDMQRYVYEYRCNGFEPDLSPIHDYYTKIESVVEEQEETLRNLEFATEPRDPWYDENIVEHYKAIAEPMFEQLKVDYAALLQDYFLTVAANDAWEDEIQQSFYFKWLYTTDRFRELMNYRGTLLAEGSLEYYRAMALFNRKRKRAALKHLSVFLRSVLDRNGLFVLRIERKVAASVAPFRETDLDKFRFYRMLDKEKLTDVISLVEGVEMDKNSIMVLISIQNALEHGEYERASFIYKNYMATFDIQKEKKRKSLRGRLDFVIKKRMTDKMKKLMQEYAAEGGEG